MAGPVQLIQSPNDAKTYRYLELPNQMQVLLVRDLSMHVDENGEGITASKSEPMSEDDGAEEGSASGEDSGDESEGADGEAASQRVMRAAASMTVACGSFSDPPDMQGLSHYLEHMLFMGSKDFPDENEFSEFLVVNSGSRNAYTEAEFTNYHLDVNPASLYGALQRFAGFFTNPLFKEDSLQKEVNAVDSEFTGVRQNDTCRQFEMMAHTAAPSHPLHTFMWGNKKSLWEGPRAVGVDVRARIVEHYKAHYSASRMCLVVLGAQELDTLQAWVEELFSQVPNLKIPKLTIKDAGYPFTGSRFYLAPSVQEGHSLTVTFQIPSLLSQYGRKADEYVAHLVGHEGPGSLLSALRKRGWATEVSAGVENSGQCRNSGFYLFQVAMMLTQEGLDAGEGMGLATVGLLFEYLKMLKKKGPQEWVWAEMKGISEMAFRFEEAEDAIHTVTHLSESMLVYRPEHTLVGHYLFDEWDPTLVQQLVSLMDPGRDGMRVDLMTSDFEALEGRFSTLPNASTGKEPWFEMSYLCAPISETTLSAWRDAATSPDLALPPPNPYVPKDFTLLPGAPPNDTSDPRAAGALHYEPRFAPQGAPLPPGALLAPECILDAPGLRVFHKLVTVHGTPKADATFRLASNTFNLSPASYVRTKLMVECLDDLLTEEGYLADMANLSSNVSHSGHFGLELTVSGFNHRLPVFTMRVFEALATLKANPETFPALKEELLRRLKNQHLDLATHADYVRLHVLVQGKFDIEALIAELEKVTEADIEVHREAVLREAHLEGLVMGNISAQDAVSLARDIQRVLGAGLKMPADARRRQGTVALVDGITYNVSVPAKNPEERNSVVQCYHQLGPNSPRERALQTLVEQILQEQVFDVLRTQEQLGYSVRCMTHNTNQILGFNVMVISDKHPDFVAARIDAYLASVVPYLEGLRDQEFQQHIRSVVTLKMEPCKSLREQVDRHWSHIWYEDYWFSERYAMLAELQKLTQKDVVSYFQTKLSPSGPQRRRLCVKITSHAHLSASKSSSPTHSMHHQAPPHSARVVDVHDIKMTQQTLEPLPGYFSPLPAPVNRTDATAAAYVA